MGSAHPSAAQPRPPLAAAGLASSQEDVTVLVMQIVGFHRMSRVASPDNIMGFLTELFSLLDDISDAYGVYKVSHSYWLILPSNKSDIRVRVPAV